jgi:hypothetical protein
MQMHHSFWGSGQSRELKKHPWQEFWNSPLHSKLDSLVSGKYDDAGDLLVFWVQAAIVVEEAEIQILLSLLVIALLVFASSNQKAVVPDLPLPVRKQTTVSVLDILDWEVL